MCRCDTASTAALGPKQRAKAKSGPPTRASQGGFENPPDNACQGSDESSGRKALPHPHTGSSDILPSITQSERQDKGNNDDLCTCVCLEREKAGRERFEVGYRSRERRKRKPLC